MKVRLSSKEILAKLMATENILVEHANIPTAGFDLTNRRLLLPNWKNISDDVYTLLISHEVGHALYTPTEEWEQQVLKTKDNDLKQVVNIVEDVRIEKLIQQKYPGTVRAFRTGYDELEKSNLFGTRGKSIDSYGLLDRLNLHFKLGHFGYANVPFKDNEKIWLDKISACKTFSDVLKVAAELKQFVEENPESQGESSLDDTSDISGELSQDSSDSTPSDQDDQEKSQSKSKQKMQGSGDKEESQNSQNDDSSDEEESQSSNQLSRTQSHFDNALQELVEKNVSKYSYANLPKIELDKVIVPHKTVHSQITSYYERHNSLVYSESASHVSIFKNTSKLIVNQLANLFEMKKKAKLDIKALVSKTGKLDTNKVFSYRYNDDIFKKVTTIPQGKSHGLVMFIDLSSSMSENLAGTYEQLLNLVLFCKRVNIPFEVYGFSDSSNGRISIPNQKFNVGDLKFSDQFSLRNYFSSKMTLTEFNTAFHNMICLIRSYTDSYIGTPPQEYLNMTPLVPAIMSACEIVKRFRQDNRLDIVNTIFLTDGADTHGFEIQEANNNYYNYNTFGDYRNSIKNKDQFAPKYYIRDMTTRNQWEVKKSATETMLDILKEQSGVKVIGFHITRRSEARNIISNYESDIKKANEIFESFKTNKFCEFLNKNGYDAYYIIPSGSSLNVGSYEDGGIDTSIDWDNEKAAKKAMKVAVKSFQTTMKARIMNRIMLNRFIEHIS
jgi:hypothetical protein